MEIPDFLYTVVAKGRKYTVRFIDFTVNEVKSLDTTFSSQDDAIQAFQAAMGKAAIRYLEQSSFTQKVRSLAQCKRYDRERKEEKAQQQIKDQQ